jgi:ABC-type branched-subunit amino acid transport system substrate-binding protein
MTNKSKFLLCLLIGIWHGCYANIRIGLCLDLSGPQKNYNAEFGRGLSSYFKYINSMLANSANKLELVVIDSEYNTTKYINGLKALADSQVELIITEPITILDANDKLLQIAKTQQLPMLGANLDQKLNGFYFSYKAGYKAQMQHLINTLLSQNISPYEIMLVYEDSAFGREVNNYARDFLQKLGVDFSKIISILDKVTAVDGRLQRAGKITDPFQIFIDYAHTPDALEQSLNELKKIKKAKDKSGK